MNDGSFARALEEAITSLRKCTPLVAVSKDGGRLWRLHKAPLEGAIQLLQDLILKNKAHEEN